MYLSTYKQSPLNAWQHLKQILKPLSSGQHFLVGGLFCYFSSNFKHANGLLNIKFILEAMRRDTQPVKTFDDVLCVLAKSDKNFGHYEFLIKSLCSKC